MTGRSTPPPSRSFPPSRSVPPPSRSIPPPRSGAGLVFLFPPSLGKSKSSARAELLELALAHELGAPVSIQITADYKELETRALAGDAHLVWAPAGVCAQLEPVTRAIYKAVRQGNSTYRSALVARKEANVSLDHLDGLRAAWVDPFSIGGYLLAVDFLRQRGIEPDRVFSRQTFHRSHADALNAVTGGDADVSAITAWSDDARSLRDAIALHIGPIERKITVLAVTDAAPTDAVILTANLSDEHATRITQKLFPVGKAVKAPSFLLAAMDAEAFIHTDSSEYRPLLRLMR
ncbi:MAG: PhnD/SsuA/transferrin family substrate-binding protein [Byssovorax sp.]